MSNAVWTQGNEIKKHEQWSLDLRKWDERWKIKSIM